MNGRLVLTGLGVAAGLMLLTVSLPPSRHEPDQPDRHAAGSVPSSTSVPQHGTTTPAPAAPPEATGSVAGLLPLSESDIADGVELARRFTAAYSTWRYDETAEQFMARLAPMMSAQLRSQVERAASDPALTSRRRRLQENSTGQARAEAIRNLGPTSITVIITGVEHITTSHTIRQEKVSRYAVTVIRHKDGWQVDALQLASTGDNGDTPDGGESAGGEDP